MSLTKEELTQIGEVVAKASATAAATAMRVVLEDMRKPPTPTHEDFQKKQDDQFAWRKGGTPQRTWTRTGLATVVDPRGHEPIRARATVAFLEETGSGKVRAYRLSELDVAPAIAVFSAEFSARRKPSSCARQRRARTCARTSKRRESS